MSKASEDVFGPAAGSYAQFRKPYPELLLRRIRERFNLDGTGVLLDVGCGTGQLALSLAASFDRVIGVDVSAEMVAEAQRAATDEGVSTARFEVMAGENVASLRDAGPFKLVTYGSALHWMNVPATLSASHDVLGEECGIAILGMRSIWGGESDWERTVVNVVRKWLGDERRAGSQRFVQPSASFNDALLEAGFTVFDQGLIEASYAVDLPFIIGHLYTTSYCNPKQLGDSVQQFENELAERLLQLKLGGQFRWSPGASYIFGRKIR